MAENILLAGCGDEAQQLLSVLLSKSGFVVQSTTDVDEAIKGLWNQPAMIVVDLAMGDGRGLEVVRTARTLGLEAEVAVVSSGNDASGTNWISKYKPNAIFGKPFDFGDFVSWISEFDIQNISIPLEIIRQAA